MKRSLLVLGLLVATPLLAAGPTPTPAAAPDSRPRVTLRWTTASENENYGFFVLRGDKEQGPFRGLNEKAIAGAGSSENPHDYVFEDFDVKQGVTYYYYLESVSTKGEREKFSPVISRTCCKQAKADKPAETPSEKSPDKPKEKH